VSGDLIKAFVPYRKEERVANLSTTEVFDGTRGIAQQGVEPARTMDGLDLAQTISRRFANTNAMFFVFFPGRHKGAVARLKEKIRSSSSRMEVSIGG
jgi:hypothetical protein